MANRTVTDKPEKEVRIRFSGGAFAGIQVVIEDSDGAPRYIDYTPAQASAISTAGNRTGTQAYCTAIIADALTRAGFV